MTAKRHNLGSLNLRNSVADTLEAGLSEAPADGNQYTRKDNAWEVVSAGGISLFDEELDLTPSSDVALVAATLVSGRRYRLEFDITFAAGADDVIYLELSSDGGSTAKVVGLYCSTMTTSGNSATRAETVDVNSGWADLSGALARTRQQGFIDMTITDGQFAGESHNTQTNDVAFTQISHSLIASNVQNPDSFRLRGNSNSIASGSAIKLRRYID